MLFGALNQLFTEFVKDAPMSLDALKGQAIAQNAALACLLVPR